jgi:hypothetical protein
MLSRVAPLLIPLILIRVAVAQEIHHVTVGWGDTIRLGRWTPIYVTVSDPHAREIDLQIHGTYGEKSEALWMHQTAVAEPQPDTYCILYPINAQLSRIEVIVSDSQTGRTLGTRVLQSDSSFSSGGRLPQRLLAPQDVLIGVSGSIDDMTKLESQCKFAEIPAGILAPLRLPANFAGYDSISVLILASLDFDQIKPDQEQAILQWVNRGGNLLFMPSTSAIPGKDAIVKALPCTIGTNQTVHFPATRPTTLNARELSSRPKAEPFQFANQTGYVWRWGLGKIAVIPVDISSLEFPNKNSANDFWRSMMQPMVKVPAIVEPTSMVVSDVDEYLVPGPNAAQSVGRGQRESDAIRHVLQFMGATQPSLRIDWRSSCLWLAGMCLLLGPVDSILLMRLGQRPRTWLTLLGWIGLIVSLGGYAAARQTKPSPEISTFRLIDQVDDSAVAATDIIALNSNRPLLLPLSLDKNEWWEPANQAARAFSTDRFVDANCHQDRTGSRPQWVRLNGIEPQAWHGEVANLGPGLLRANLRLETHSDRFTHLVGTLTNASTTPITDIHISTASGNFVVNQSIAAGATINLDQLPSPDPISLANQPADVLDLSPERADRVEELIKSGRAVVLGQMPDAIGVKVGADVQNHWQILRAIFSIGK